MDISALFYSVVDNVPGDRGYLPLSETGTSCFGVELKGCEQSQPLCYVLQIPACVICRCVGQQRLHAFQFLPFLPLSLCLLSVRWR